MAEILKPGDVLAAAERLQGIVNRTPVLTSRTLDERCGSRIYLKCENFQRVGAFKFRGAYHALSRLSMQEKKAGVITHSSGNHAQGVALAAKLLGIPAVIVMPEDAPPIKRQATEGYGATIVPCQAIDREKVTSELIERHGYTLIHPYDNNDIILGQGTAAAELFDEVGPLDLLFAPVGGGGLLSGSALAAAALSPECRVIGVEPAIAADANQSWRENQIVTLDHVPQTMADGLRTRYIGERNLAVMQHYVHEMLTVTEQEIKDTLQFIWNFLKIIVEPSSAVALAPIFSEKYNVEDMRAGIVLSGGNVSLPVDNLYGDSEAQKQEDAPPLAVRTGPAKPRSLRPRVLITDDQFDPAAREVLEQVADVEMCRDDRDVTLDAIADDYQALIVGPEQQVSAPVIENGYELLAIGTPSTRPDNINVSTARTFGIEICYVPDGNAVVIAEHTMARLLLLENKLQLGGLSGKTLGLVGFGRVGLQVARRAAAFGMNVIVNQPRLTPELAVTSGVKAADLITLLQESDFVSLHVPYNPETQFLIGKTELAHMKKTAFLINAGHTELVDEAALFEAVDSGQIAGAALSELTGVVDNPDSQSIALRSHDRVLLSPHITSIIDQQRPKLCLAVAEQIAGLLHRAGTNKALPLELVPVSQVTPHEEIDIKRVQRLMTRFEVDRWLVNPPITIRWKGRYVLLDGATRYAALKRLGYRYLIVQVVEPSQTDFQLHTWFHVVINPDKPLSDLFEHLERIDGLRLLPLETKDIQSALSEPRTFCYFLDQQGRATMAQEEPGVNRLAVMKDLVHAYSSWGLVERTLITDIDRLMAQFPQMKTVAVFPQFVPHDVFDAARDNNLLPAGLSRFIIPGRILRLNAELARLKRDESLSEKRAWFDEFLAEKMRRSRLRFYEEPVVLMDE
jgi:threo-3-hydroxy-L-aspartate ammonia-lyase